MIEDDVP